jgi:hypothetical protein
MRDHYVPQHYLEGFTDSSHRIYQYERGSTDILRTSTKAVANENHRWPKETELYLANEVEAPANAVLDSIRNRQPITQSSRDILSTYMVVMLQRVPKGLARVKARAPEVQESVFSEVESKILTLIEEHPSKRKVLENALEGLPSLRAKYLDDFPMEVWYQLLTPDSMPRVRAILPAMTWVFLTTDKSCPFLTSDNPFFFFEHIGIGKPESEITFPISSTVVLWATWRSNLVEGYVPARDTIVRETNRRMASSATRYSYCSMETPWIVSLVNKKNPRLHRLT